MVEKEMKNTQKEQKKTQTEDSTDPLLALFVMNQCQKTLRLTGTKKKKWLQPGISEIDGVRMLSVVQF